MEILEQQAQPTNRPRITTRYMTKYERARILGTRALQIRCAQTGTLHIEKAMRWRSMSQPLQPSSAISACPDQHKFLPVVMCGPVSRWRLSPGAIEENSCVLQHECACHGRAEWGVGPTGHRDEGAAREEDPFHSATISSGWQVSTIRVLRMSTSCAPTVRSAI